MINSLFRTVLSLRTLLFEWDAKLFVMKPVSNHRYMFSILCSIKIWAYLVFAIFRCIQHMKDGVSGKLVVSEVAEIVRLGLGSVLQYTNITRPKEIINGTNQLLNFNIRLRSEFGFTPKLRSSRDYWPISQFLYSQDFTLRRGRRRSGGPTCVRN